jgi:signal-transduction protein with cAMP-binding, CBS, and nucleotidyltransferase domain
VDVNADTGEAARLMRENAVRRLPVIEDGQVAGVVSLGDLAMHEGLVMHEDLIMHEDLAGLTA